MSLQPFHLAIPVHDLAIAREFYATVFGCAMGRSSSTWSDFDFFGHQLVVHQDAGGIQPRPHCSLVDGDDVPVPHFGVVLEMTRWKQLRDRLLALDGVRWVIRPHIRFAGQVGEQATMFLLDPSANALEFKAFDDPAQLFAKP